jgi:predicted phage terminase large subunit-like protein
MAALQYVDIPGYSAILFRRKFVDLNQPSALIPRSKEWLKRWESAGRCVWNGADHQWTFQTSDPDRPAVLKFGHLEHEDAKFNYQGAEYQFIGFDELTQFTAPMYDYLSTRLRRTTDMTVPLRMRASANPGGIGHEWVKERFIGTPEQPVKDVDKVFIPSRLEDNPSLDAVEYERSLSAISDPTLRKQLRNGDWEIRPSGDMFKRHWFRIVDVAPADIRWVRYWDLAATEPHPGNKDPDWTAGAKVGVEFLEGGARRVWVADVRRKRLGPAGVQEFVKSTAEEDGKGVSIFIEEEPGSSGKNNTHHYVTTVLFGYDVHGRKKSTNKVVEWRPLAAQAEVGNVMLLRGPWNKWWLDEAEAAPQPGVHDDGLDAVAGGMREAGGTNLVYFSSSWG